MFSWKRPATVGLAFAAALGFVTLYSYPYFARIYNANELPRIALVDAILKDGSLSIGDRAHPPGQQTDTAFYEGRYYSNKAPGLSFLGVPVVWAERQVHAALGLPPPSLFAETYVLRLFCVTLPALAFLLVVWRLTGLYSDDRRARATALAGYALATLALPVSLLYMSHQPAAALVGTAFVLLIGRPGVAAAAVAGFLAGLAMVCDYQSAFFLAPVAVYALVRVRPVRQLVVAAAASAPPLVALLLYHKACFGKIGRTGYEFATLPEFRAIHHTGFLGLSAPSAKSFFQSFLAPDNGLFVLSPWLLLGVAGWFVAWRARRNRPEVAVAAGIGATAILFLTCLLFARGGWQMGPRYIAIAVPFFAAPAAAALAALPERVRAAAVGLVLGAAILHVAGALTFPTWPDKLANPVVELVWPIWRDGLVPYSLGHALGLGGLAALLPPLVVTVAVVLAAARPSRAGVVIAFVVASLFLVHFRLYPRTHGAEAARIYGWVRSIWEP